MDDAFGENAEQPDGDDVARSQAAVTLNEIAGQLRELAGVLVDLSKQPLGQAPQTLH